MQIDIVMYKHLVYMFWHIITLKERAFTADFRLRVVVKY